MGKTKDPKVWGQVGVSLTTEEFERLRMCIGNESPGWVLRQLLYDFVLKCEIGQAEMPDRRTSPIRMPAPLKSPDKVPKNRR